MKIIFSLLIIFYSIYQSIKFYSNPNKKFKGQDQFMNSNWDYSYIMFLCSLYDNCKDLDKQIINYIEKKYENPKSIFRIKKNNNYYYYTDTSVNEIIKQCIIPKKTLNFYEIYEEIKDKKLEWSYYYSGNKFIFIANHTFFDGISAINNAFGFFKNFKKFKPKLNGNYIPIIDELKILKSLPKLINIPTKRNINNYIDYKTPLNEYKPKIIFKSLPVSRIKLLKSKYKINFIDVLVSNICQTIFNSSNKNELNVCITVAFDSNYRFNNVGVILIQIKKQNTIEELLTEVHKQIQNNKNMASSTYKLSNIYNYYDKNKFIDIIITSLCISKDKDIVLSSNEKLISCNPIFMFSIAPVFITCATINDKIDLTYCIRSNEINMN